MTTDVKTPQDEKAEKARAAAEAKAKKEAEAKAEKERKAKEREEEKAKKTAEREAAKAKKAEDAAKAKAEATQKKIETAAKDGGIELDSVTGSGPDGAITLADVKSAIQRKKAEERANRPKRAPLTLSQRRAVLKLADGPITPANAFNATPLDYLVSVGLAQSATVTVPEEYVETEDQEVEIPEADRKEGGPATKTVKAKVTKTRDVNRQQYSLTDTGVGRAQELNPKWKTWKPDSAPAATTDDSGGDGTDG